MRKELGKYIVSDTDICGGAPTFAGTRIPVSDALHYLALGHSFEWIAEAYNYLIEAAAIAEAVELANQALITLNDSTRRKHSATRTRKVATA
jgi:uncharacterized protein (DUF433 family)